MILELTKENLQKCGFKENDINDLLTQENHSCFLLSDTCYYANNLEKKIYAKIDGYKKYYFENGSINFPINCPELIPSYFDLSLNAYLFQQKNLLKTMFIKEDQVKKFILVEIEKTKERIENQKVMLKRLPQINVVIKENAINIFDAYISFLNTKLTDPKTQPEIEIIQRYKESVSNYISTVIDLTDKDGNKNPFYYYNRIIAFRKNIDEMLNSNNNVKERYDLLFSFNFKISNCLKDIAELFFAYHNYDEKEPFLLNDINFKLCDIKDSFESIKEIQQNIAYNISTGDYDIAIKIQKYCIPLFKEIKLISKRDFFIDIDKSPLNIEFDGVLKVLENCINYNEIQISNDLKKDKEREPQQSEIIKPKDKEYRYLGQPTNEQANLFFEFLCENYRPDQKTQVKYVNILYYLKNDADKKHFIYKVKQKDYPKLIEKTGVKISKFEKSANYDDVEKPIFHSLENTFLKNMIV